MDTRTLRQRSRTALVGVAVLGAFLLAGCGANGKTSPPPTATRAAALGATPGTSPIVASEKPVAPETNPVGDIPDTQAFVSYSSTAGGFTLDAPEGWARTENGSDVQWVNVLDGEQVALAAAATAPTAASARGDVAAAIARAGRAVQIASVQDVQLPGGRAVLIAYTANSAPDAVTDKQVRLEEHAYLFFKSGRLATLTLWAPQGSDNVDQWQRIANSFRWS